MTGTLRSLGRVHDQMPVRFQLDGRLGGDWVDGLAGSFPVLEQPR